MNESANKNYILELAQRAKRAAGVLATSSGEQRSKALQAIARNLRSQTGQLIKANKEDLSAGQKAGLSEAMLERLLLDKDRIEKMAQSVEQIALANDPVGEVIDGWTLPSGLVIHKLRVPLGVVAVIYESRPNVTSDAAALSLKAGNAVILRGGKEAIHSNSAIARAIRTALEEVGLDQEAVGFVERTERELVNELLKLDSLIDVVIPRGGESLIQAVVENSRIPVIKHYKGVCHVYVDAEADLEMAHRITMNAKVQRPGVCNAAETLLVHADVAEEFLPSVCDELAAAGVELRGCESTRRLCRSVNEASEEDWFAEYLSLILSIKVVSSLDEAIEHINRYGSAHTDAIITKDIQASQRFVAGVDSASVMVNASTRLSDGGVYGLGAEVGISTDKLHARGPMGAADLTTYKYVVYGQGHLRD